MTNVEAQTDFVEDSFTSSSFLARPEPRSQPETVTPGQAVEFFDFRIAFDGTLLAIAPHVMGLPNVNMLFNKTQGQLLPNSGDLANWFHAIRATLDSGKPRLFALGLAGEVVHVILSPSSVDSAALRVVIERSNACSATVFDAYRECYNLTKTEAEILWELTHGLEPKRIAANKSVSVSTVRTQIKSILQKTSEPNMRNLLLRIATLGHSA